MTNQLLATWIFGGISFAILCWTVIAPKSLPPANHPQAGILFAICAGLFTFFLTGSLYLHLSGDSEKLGKLTIQASGEGALFLIVLSSWNSSLNPSKPSREIKKSK